MKIGYKIALHSTVVVAFYNSSSGGSTLIEAEEERWEEGFWRGDMEKGKYFKCK